LADARKAGVALPALGLGIAAAEELVLHEWAEASIGYYESDFVGPTALLSLTVVLLAIALFGTRVAPVGASLPPKLSAIIGAMTVLIIALSNLPALADGIGQGGLVAVTIGLTGAYAVVALFAIVPRR
jgi:hypothetical protein